MSTWVASAVKGAAVVGTGSASGGVTRAITPGALYGFAAGALLTGMCFLLAVKLRRARRAARRDYYAAPGDTHSVVGDADDLHELADPGAPAAPVVYAAPEDPAEIEEAVAAIDEATEPELPLEFGDPVVDVLEPAASEDYAKDGEDDPYAPEIFPTVPSPYELSPYEPSAYEPSAYEPSAYEPSAYEPSAFDPDPFTENPSAPDPYAAAEAFGSSDYDDDHHLRRGYRSKHRITAADTMAPRPEARRGAPRHAAPSARFSSRASSRQDPVPMVSARS